MPKKVADLPTWLAALGAIAVPLASLLVATGAYTARLDALEDKEARLERRIESIAADVAQTKAAVAEGNATTARILGVLTGDPR